MGEVITMAGRPRQGSSRHGRARNIGRIHVRAGGFAQANCGHVQFSSAEASARIAAALESPGGCVIVVPRKQRGRREDRVPDAPAARVQW